MKTFIAFSGGIDSTYNLWRWLSNHPNQTLLVHHVVYYNREGRADLEKKAVHDILKWCDQQGLTNYEYRESVLDLRDFPRFGFDTVTLASVHATLLTGYPGIHTMLNNAPKDEYERLGAELDRRKRKQNEIFQIILGKRLMVRYALKNKTKQEIIEDIPKDLLKLTWHCRRPRANGDPCDVCHTCKQVRG